MSSGSKEEERAAEDTFMAAKDIEIAAGQSLVSNSEMASGVSQQATLDNLRAIASTPGMNKFDVRRANAAVKAAEEQIAGKSYNYEQAVNKIANDEKQFNVYRVDLYKKDIEAAKASGKTREMANLQRDMERYKQNRIDEVVYREAIQTEQSNYLEVLNNVAARTAALSGISLQETTKALAGQSLVSNADTSFSIMDAKSMSQDEARTANYAKEAARAANPTATLSTDTNALRAAGASAEQATAYEAARATKQAARQNWDAAMASGNKVASQAAEDAFMAARAAESAAGVAAVAAAASSAAAAPAAPSPTTSTSTSSSQCEISLGSRTPVAIASPSEFSIGVRS